MMKRTLDWKNRAVLAVALLLPLAAVPAHADVVDDITGTLGQVLGGSSLGLVERAIASQLPREIGPARQYQVHVDPNGANLLRGSLSHVDVTGLDVQTSDGLVIPQMDIHMDGIKMDLASHGLRSITNSLFSAILDQNAVTRYIQKRGGVRVKDVSVAIRNGQLFVRGTPEVIGIGMPTQVVGRPVIDGNEKVDFRASSVSVFGIGLPGFATHALENKVNPIADLSHLRIPVKITDLGVQGNHLVANGKLDFSKLTR